MPRLWPVSLAVPVSTAVSTAFMLVAASAPVAAAQRQPPLVGTVSPGAIGAPAPTPVPIGGLRTRPMDGGSRTVDAISHFRQGVFPLVVVDAPRSRGGIVPAAAEPSTAWRTWPSWTPSAERPRWIYDASVTRVDAWRDLIVTDVVCNGAGTCLERRQRVRARWIAGCACYAFADGWSRVWRVE